MKKFIKKSLTGVLVAATVLSTALCGACSKEEHPTLYVYSFTSGFGSQWLESLIADYEAKMKDVEIDGKKGLRIKPTADKSDVPGASMASSGQDIFFLEQQDYYELLAGNYIADITSAVTSVNPYDGKTLESKMFDSQKAYLGREVNGEMRYYAYPHYFTSFGIAYDVELFNTKGYYFADGYDASGALQDMFLGSQGGTKTAGPDGQMGTSDDGLPTTYDEFLLLCDYISGVGNDNPLIWAGQYRESYLTHFINALATDYEGDEMRLNFSFDGTATSLGTVVGGEVVEDAQDTVIDGTNGAELARQAGKYYAMDFYQDIFNKSYIQDKQSTLFSSTYDHKEAQEDFLKKSNVRNAMLLDGSWWQMEAKDAFEIMGKTNPANSKQNRQIGWMPLPKQSTAKVGEEVMMYDIMYPLCVMRNGMDPNSWQYKYALDFIQFANSDEQLAKFTQITGCTKALNYELTDAQYDGLSYFGKSFYDSYKAADIVFPYDNNLLFANNQKTFQELDRGEGSPLYKSTKYATSFVKAIEGSNPVSLETYFGGMYEFFKEKTIWKKAK